MEQNNNTLEKPQNQGQKPNTKLQETGARIEKIRQDERYDFIKDELKKIGKVTPDNPKVNFLFSDKNGNKDTMKIDMIAQTLEFQGKTIKIELPKGATMSSITFSQDSVKIDGRLGFFSGSGSAEYKNLIQAIDNVMQKGNYTLLAGKEQIGFRLV